eukprot:13143361-Heterocapsa_arctica.AAC.1
MPVGEDLARAFFKEKGRTRYALDATEVLQREYGMDDLYDMCDKIADALETYLLTPQRNETE